MAGTVNTSSWMRLRNGLVAMGITEAGKKSYQCRMTCVLCGAPKYTSLQHLVTCPAIANTHQLVNEPSTAWERAYVVFKDPISTQDYAAELEAHMTVA